MDAVYDEEFVGGKNIEGALEKLGDCGLLTEKYVRENGKLENRYFNGSGVAKYFEEFSYAATEKQLEQMSGEEIVKHWLKLTGRLYLQDIN